MSATLESPPAARTTTARGHAPLEVMRPRSVEDVRDIVEDARRHGRPLYPVSTGRNWGYGSASPVVAGCTLVDLSGMNRIRNLEAISRHRPAARDQHPGQCAGPRRRLPRSAAR
jgi:FAD/FMN-containing dehydrogenase